MSSVRSSRLCASARLTGGSSQYARPCSTTLRSRDKRIRTPNLEFLDSCPDHPLSGDFTTHRSESVLIIGENSTVGEQNLPNNFITPVLLNTLNINQHQRNMLDCNLSYDLPPEIQDQIFECAARMHPKFSPNLSVISKRVQTRIERIIYESLYLFPSSYDLPFPRPPEIACLSRFWFMFHRRPAEFFATHVRNIYFNYTVIYRDAKLVLEKCTGLEHLVFLLMPQHPQVHDAGSLILPSAHTLQSLMTTRDILNDMAGSNIVFPRLRYLWIELEPYHIRVPALEWLPALHTIEFILYKEPGMDDSWQEDAKTVMSTAQHLRFIGLYADEDYLDDVERWKETVAGPIKIKISPFNLYTSSFLRRWRRLIIDGLPQVHI